MLRLASSHTMSLLAAPWRYIPIVMKSPAVIVALDRCRTGAGENGYFRRCDARCTSTFHAHVHDTEQLERDDAAPSGLGDVPPPHPGLSILLLVIAVIGNAFRRRWLIDANRGVVRFVGTFTRVK